MPRNLTETLYALLLLLLPIAYCKDSIDPALMPRQLLLGIFMLFLLVVILLRKVAFHLFNWKNPIYLAVGGYILLSLPAFFDNPFTSESHAVLSKQLLLFGLLFLTTALLKGKAIRERQIIHSVILFGFIAIGAVVFQLTYKTLDNYNLFSKITIINGLFANKNLLASVLFLCIPFFLIGMQFSKKIKILCILGLGFTLPILIIIRTRTVLLAVLLYVFILLCFYLKNRFNIGKRYILLTGIALFLVGFFVILDGLKKNPVKYDGTISTQYLNRIIETNTLKSRSDFWGNSFDMVKEHPIFGVGYGNWQVQFPKYGLQKLKDYEIINGTKTLQRAHNDFLQILCENGLLGFLAYCCVFGLIFYYLLALIRNAETTLERWKFIYLLGGISGYVLIAFADFPTERIEHQVLLMLLFALVVSNYQRTAICSSQNKLAIYLLFFIAIYAVIVASFRFKGEKETVLLYKANDHQQWNDVIYYANKAQSRFYKIDPTSIPLDWYSGNAYFGRGQINESKDNLENAYHLAPFQIQVLNNLATSYAANGEIEKAIQFYTEALRISPDFADARLNLTKLYFSQQQFSEAFQTIDQIDVHSENKRYLSYLVPILTQELNAILARNNNPVLTAKVAANITTSEQIIALYRNSKSKNKSLETYVLQYK